MNNHDIKFMFPLLLLSGILLLLSGCFSGWSPTDEEALRLLKDYYSFYESRAVEAKIVSRGKYIKECKCYPIEFEITDSRGERFKRTFYFYKDASGAVEIRKYQFGLKFAP